jgi:hypothetical protein
MVASQVHTLTEIATNNLFSNAISTGTNFSEIAVSSSGMFFLVLWLGLAMFLTFFCSHRRALPSNVQSKTTIRHDL